MLRKQQVELEMLPLIISTFIFIPITRFSDSVLSTYKSSSLIILIFTIFDCCFHVINYYLGKSYYEKIYYWYRCLKIFIYSRLFYSQVNVNAIITRNYRVSVLDCEGLRYMANSRFNYYMDFIRLELMFRSSLYDNTVKKGMLAILGSQKVIYKKPLKLLSKFSVKLILEEWDEKWAYHRHIFIQDHQICAIGLSKLAFRKNKKMQNMEKIIIDCGIAKSGIRPTPAIKHVFNQDYELLRIAELENSKNPKDN